MLQKEYPHDAVCDICNGTRFIGVAKKDDGFEFIECEKCRGTGHLSLIQFGFTKDEDDE